jgi:hypothetical protein
VLAWDWVMAGTTRFDGIQAALRDMDRGAYRSVGWSILWNPAVAQLGTPGGSVEDATSPSTSAEQTPGPDVVAPGAVAGDTGSR